MLLNHARARAHTLIYRSSEPDTTYLKSADVPEPDAEDWEPITTDPNYEPPSVAEDCDCGGETPSNEEPDV